MAKLQYGDESIDIEDGFEVKEAAEQLGVPFGCKSGSCGTCTCEVIQGMNNLTPLTAPEEEMELQENQRLLCQCKIISGVVKIDFDE